MRLCILSQIQTPIPRAIQHAIYPHIKEAYLYLYISPVTELKIAADEDDVEHSTVETLVQEPRELFLSGGSVKMGSHQPVPTPIENTDREMESSTTLF